MKLTRIFFAFFILASFSGCVKSIDDLIDQTDQTTGSPSSQGQIYFRLYQSSNEPKCYTGLQEQYLDNNDAVPVNPFRGTLYGPCEPGLYSAEFVFDPSCCTTKISFNYNLARPAAGYRRVYTQTLRMYSSSVNRCLTTVSGTDNGISYVDEKL